MGSRYGLEIRSALPADAPGLAALLSAAGHPVAAPVLAERIEQGRLKVVSACYDLASGLVAFDA